ncbi:MAG: NAD(P)/FAD-dependent oxidoreductase [Clostridia bacterium]|nr:NAD(P)/FAD-dependent oxidoreductase [Clostridia bacterium]
MYDAVVIGAGVVGGLIARKLTSCSQKVCIADKASDIAMGATKANSAIVHAGFDAKAGSLKAKLNKLGSDMMEKVCSELGVKYIRNGSLVLGYNDEDKKSLEAILENGKLNGIEGLKLIDAKELHDLEPNVSDDAIWALHAPTGAIVCPYELCEAAIGNAMDNGAQLELGFEVCEITNDESGYTIVAKDGRKLQAKIVINAAGAYSDEMAKLVGDNSFDVHPRKGEYILLDKEYGFVTKHTLFTVPTKMGKGILVSPTVDGNLILGPTAVDFDEKENKQTTREGINSVITESRRMVKNAPSNMAITSFCGLRSVGSTGDFIINSPQKGFINVAGIESPGLSASPAIAEYIAEMLKNDGFTLKPKADFNPVREATHKFSSLSDEEKNEIIKNDPSFGKIICRCENVTEGEILRAIRTNPKATTLDGVKRRTRAQMGRCQGGFCSPYITELLAKELGITMEEVTKSGKGSFILAGKTKGDLKDA